MLRQPGTRVFCLIPTDAESQSHARIVDRGKTSVPRNVAPEVDIIQRAWLLAHVPVQVAPEHANASALAALVSA